MCEFFEEMSCMRCFCSCIWGNPDPGPVRLRDVQQVKLDTSKMGEHFQTYTYKLNFVPGGLIDKSASVYTSLIWSRHSLQVQS